MTTFEQRARTLTLPENLGERIVLIARMAVSEHLRQAIAAGNHSREMVGHSDSHLGIGGVVQELFARQPGTEAA